MIWLYCEVIPITLNVRVTWSKDNIPLLQDVPHIRLRNYTSTYSTTLLLVVDKFQSSDGGTYQWTAQDIGITAIGDTLTLTGDELPDLRT